MEEIKMSESSRDFLKKYMPEFFSQPYYEAMLALDAFITANGLDSDDEITDFGREAEAVYDEIIYLNND